MEPRNHLPRHIKVVLAGCFINCAFSFAFPMMPLLISGSVDSRVSLSWLMSLVYLICSVLQPKFGSLLDRGKPVAVVATASTLACFGMMGLLWMPTAMPALILSLVSIVVGISVLSMTASKIVEGQVEDNVRGRVSLLFSGIGNLGFGLSAIFSYFFLAEYKSVLLVFDMISTFFFAAILLVVELGMRSGSRNSASLLNCSSEIKSTLQRGQVMVLSGVLCFFVAMVSSLTIVPLQYQNKGLDTTRFNPVMFGVNNIVIFIGCMVFLERIGRLKTSTLVAASAILLSLGLSLVPTVQNQTGNILVTVIWSVGEVLAYPAISKLVFAAFPKGAEGRAAGYKAAALRLAYVIGPACVAFSNEAQGVWWISLLLGSIPVIGLLFLWNTIRNKMSLTQATYA